MEIGVGKSVEKSDFNRLLPFDFALPVNYATGSAYSDYSTPSDSSYPQLSNDCDDCAKASSLPYDPDIPLIVTGVNYPADYVDTDGDAIEADEIRKMAHAFIGNGRTDQIDFEHDGQVNTSAARIVESWVVEVGADSQYPAGSWVIRMAIIDPTLKDLVLRGEINGFSLSGKAFQEIKIVRLMHPVRSVGMVDVSIDGLFPPHSHQLEMEYGWDSKVIPTMTGETLGHRHEVITTTATEMAWDHAHRIVLDTSGTVQKGDGSGDISNFKLKTDYIPQIRKVTFLRDVDVCMISPVRQAANWTPFESVTQYPPGMAPQFVTKSDLHKNDNSQQNTDNPWEDLMPGQIIQSVIMPDSEEFNELIKQDQYKWLAPGRIFKTDKSDTMTTHIFIEKDHFVPGSFDARSVGNGLALFGELASGKTEILKGDGDNRRSVIAVPVSWTNKEINKSEDRVNSSLDQTNKDTGKQKPKEKIDMNPEEVRTIFQEELAKADKGKVPPPDSGGISEARVKEIVMQCLKAEDDAETAAEAKKGDKASLATLVKSMTDLTGIVTGLQSDVSAIKKGDTSRANAPETPPVVTVEMVEKLKSDQVALVSNVNAMSEQLGRLVHAVAGPPPTPDTLVHTTVIKGDKQKFSGVFGH